MQKYLYTLRVLCTNIMLYTRTLQIISLLTLSTFSCFSMNSCGRESVLSQYSSEPIQSMYVNLRIRETPDVPEAREFAVHHNIQTDTLIGGTISDNGAHVFGETWGSTEIDGRRYVEFFVLRCGQYAENDTTIVIDNLFIPIQYPLDIDSIIQRNREKLSHCPNLLIYMDYLNTLMFKATQMNEILNSLTPHDTANNILETGEDSNLFDPEGIEVENDAHVIFHSGNTSYPFHSETDAISLNSIKITQIADNLLELSHLNYISLRYCGLTGNVSFPPLPPSLKHLILSDNEITSFSMKSAPECFVNLQKNPLTRVSIEGDVKNIYLTLDGAFFQNEDDFNCIASVIKQPKWNINFKSTSPYLHSMNVYGKEIYEGGYVKIQGSSIDFNSLESQRPLIYNLLYDYSGKKQGQKEHPLLTVLLNIRNHSSPR